MPEDAHLAALALEKEDIGFFFEAERTVGNLWLLGNAIGYVKLQVEHDDVQRVEAILEKARRSTDESSAVIGRCATCGAKTEPGFDVCWSCGATLEPDLTPSAEPPSSPHQPSGRHATAANRGMEEDDEQDGTEAEDAQLDAVSEDLASRAWKGALFGLSLWALGLWPWILHGYSFWLVLRLAFRGGWLSPAGNRKFYAALFVDLTFAAVVGFFLYMSSSR